MIRLARALLNLLADAETLDVLSALLGGRGDLLAGGQLLTRLSQLLLSRDLLSGDLTGLTLELLTRYLLSSSRRQLLTGYLLTRNLLSGLALELLSRNLLSRLSLEALNRGTLQRLTSGRQASDRGRSDNACGTNHLRVKAGLNNGGLKLTELIRTQHSDFQQAAVDVHGLMETLEVVFRTMNLDAVDREQDVAWPQAKLECVRAWLNIDQLHALVAQVALQAELDRSDGLWVNAVLWSVVLSNVNRTTWGVTVIASLCLRGGDTGDGGQSQDAGGQFVLDRGHRFSLCVFGLYL